MNLFTKQRMNLFLQRKIRGRDIQGVRDGHVHTAIFKMDNPQGPTVQHREVCLMLYGGLDERGVQGRMETCISMADFLCCPPETPTLLIGYIPIQNKNVNKKKRTDVFWGPLSQLPSPGFYFPIIKINFSCFTGKTGRFNHK